jgi:hypothetical protein
VCLLVMAMMLPGVNSDPWKPSLRAEQDCGTEGPIHDTGCFRSCACAQAESLPENGIIVSKRVG